MKILGKFVFHFIILLAIASCSEMSSEPEYQMITLDESYSDIRVSDIQELVNYARAATQKFGDGSTLIGIGGRLHCQSLPRIQGEIYILSAKEMGPSLGGLPVLQVNTTIDTMQQLIEMKRFRTSYFDITAAPIEIVAEFEEVANTLVNVLSKMDDNCIAWVTHIGDHLWQVRCESFTNESASNCDFLVDIRNGKGEVVDR